MTNATPIDVIGGRARFCVVTAGNLEVLKLLPDKSIHHCLMDPPYSEHCHSKSRAGSRKTPLLDGNGHLSRCAIDREVSFGFDHITQQEMEDVSDQLDRLVTRWSMAFSDIESCHLWKGAMSSAGLEYCRTLIWEKIGATPQFTGDRPGVGAEVMTLCHPKGKKRWNSGGKLGIYRHLTAQERGGQKRTNNTREHPTQKPLDLMLELVADFTDPDDIIIDPYCGSGTTLVAALRLGRRAIGIERNPVPKTGEEPIDWAQVARDRCAAELNLSDAKSMRAGQTALFQL